MDILSPISEKITPNLQESYSKKIDEIVDYYLNSNQGRELTGFVKSFKAGGEKEGTRDLGGITEDKVWHMTTGEITYKSEKKVGELSELEFSFSYDEDAKSKTIKIIDRRQFEERSQSHSTLNLPQHSRYDSINISSQNSSFRVYYGIRGVYNEGFIKSELDLVENCLGKEVEKKTSSNVSDPSATNIFASRDSVQCLKPIRF